MPRYIIERPLPDAGKLSSEDLQAISATSNAVLAELQREGKHVRWEQSYVSANAIHCLYDASDPDVIREHARRGGFPCDAVMEVAAVIDPSTGQ